MNPIDYRNATWRDIRAKLNVDRSQVWNALAKHGPCTTRELSSAMRWDILSVRPRVTELVQLGFARLHVVSGVTIRREHEGVYEALTEAEAMKLCEQRMTEARREVQPSLGL